MSKVTVRVDFENNGETWWYYAQKSNDVPAELRALVEQRAASKVSVDISRIPDVWAWCAGIAGWDDGDKRAPHPLMVASVWVPNTSPTGVAVATLAAWDGEEWRTLDGFVIDISDACDDEDEAVRRARQTWACS